MSAYANYYIYHSATFCVRLMYMWANFYFGYFKTSHKSYIFSELGATKTIADEWGVELIDPTLDMC